MNRSHASPFPWLFLLLVSATLDWLQAQTPAREAPLSALARVFASPPDDARVMMRWWWFGPAVTADGLDRDLEAMRTAGLGGVEVQPVYPLALNDVAPSTHIRPFLSPSYLESLAHARATAARLGLRFDLTLGRPVTSSETWTWLHSPSFAATPLDIKVEAGRHFLQGVTQLSASRECAKQARTVTD